MSQPAVSDAVARLRDAFKDELIVRHGRGVHRTPPADAVYGGAVECVGLRCSASPRRGREVCSREYLSASRIARGGHHQDDTRQVGLDSEQGNGSGAGVHSQADRVGISRRHGARAVLISLTSSQERISAVDDIWRPM